MRKRIEKENIQDKATVKVSETIIIIIKGLLYIHTYIHNHRLRQYIHIYIIID